MIAGKFYSESIKSNLQNLYTNCGRLCLSHSCVDRLGPLSATSIGKASPNGVLKDARAKEAGGGGEGLAIFACLYIDSGRMVTHSCPSV